MSTNYLLFDSRLQQVLNLPVTYLSEDPKSKKPFIFIIFSIIYAYHCNFIRHLFHQFTKIRDFTIIRHLVQNSFIFVYSSLVFIKVIWLAKQSTAVGLTEGL